VFGGTLNLTQSINHAFGVAAAPAWNSIAVTDGHQTTTKCISAQTSIALRHLTQWRDTVAYLQLTGLG